MHRAVERRSLVEVEVHQVGLVYCLVVSVWRHCRVRRVARYLGVDMRERQVERPQERLEERHRAVERLEESDKFVNHITTLFFLTSTYCILDGLCWWWKNTILTVLSELGCPRLNLVQTLVDLGPLVRRSLTIHVRSAHRVTR